MSSETDNPRQRTVAELLAEHGDAGVTGRRRRRREAGEPGIAPPVPALGAAGATGSVTHAWSGAAPDRAILREPVPRDAAPPDLHSVPDLQPVPEIQPRDAAPSPVLDPLSVAPSTAPPVEPEPAPSEGVAAVIGHRPPRDPALDRPTDTMPRVRDVRPRALDPGLTGPIEHQTRANPDALVDGVLAEGEPAEPGAVASRTPRQAVDLFDGGPPTQAGKPALGFDDFDDHPAGLGDAENGDGSAADATPRRRLGRATAAGSSTGQAWMAVVAQWIIGAVGGAALWVGFRFLWRELPVVALAAAVLVTVALVLIVRALLRNNDMRTTVFAVLVGLLLTVSPALLVLLDR